MLPQMLPRRTVRAERLKLFRHGWHQVTLKIGGLRD
jgi:hypothetical protein